MFIDTFMVYKYDWHMAYRQNHLRILDSVLLVLQSFERIRVDGSHHKSYPVDIELLKYFCGEILRPFAAQRFISGAESRIRVVS